MDDDYSKCLDCEYDRTPSTQAYCNYCRSTNIEGGACHICKNPQDDCTCFECSNCERKIDGDKESSCDVCDECMECCDCLVCPNCDNRGIEGTCENCDSCDDCCECEHCSECKNIMTEDFKCEDCLTCKNCECEHYKNKPKKVVKKRLSKLSKKKKLHSSKSKITSSKLRKTEYNKKLKEMAKAWK